MSNNAITVDFGLPGGADLTAFLRDAGAVHAALESMKASARALGAGLSRADRGLVRMEARAEGVAAALMRSKNLADGLSKGMKDLYRWSRENRRAFAGQLDGLAASARYLRDSLAAMAAPLIRALAPAVDFVTDRLAGLFNLINQLLARLSGASTWVAAKKAATAWDGVTDGIQGATAALKRYLASFDQLNVLGDGAGDAAGGGGGGDGAAGLFEERPIESGLAAFADALRAALEASDWASLGALIGDRLNRLVASVDWAALGQKVGYYVNALFSTAYWTLDTVNFEAIGESIAEFMNNALAEIDFTTVGAAVAGLFTSLFELMAGFAASFDWAQLAEKLADGVNGFVATLDTRLSAVDWAELALRLTEGLNAFIARTDWAALGSALGGRINDLLAVAGAAAATFDWAGAGAALAEGVNGLFRRVDWDGLGLWLNDTLLGVLDFGLAFFEGFDAAGFADGVGRALSRVDWDGVARKLWALLKAALSKLGEFVGALLTGGSADVSLNLELLRKGWSTVAAWLGIDNPLSALLGLVKDGWTTLPAFVGTGGSPLSARVNLVKNNFTSLGAFVGTGTPLSAWLSLVKSGWSTLGGFVGTANALTAKVGLKKDNWTTLDFFVGTVNTITAWLNLAKNNFTTLGGFIGTGNPVTADVKLEKSGWSTIAEFVGTSVKVWATLDKEYDYQTSGYLFGEYITVLAALAKQNSKQSSAKLFGTSITVTASLVASGLTALKNRLSKGVESAISKGYNNFLNKHKNNAQGGAITPGGRHMAFAGGGVISGGAARYLAGVPHYAGGTSRAHGTVFVAGEAGPEIMGHINGRTEILNKSQLAQAIYSAVVSGMGAAVNALGSYLANRMGECANAIVATISHVGSVGGLNGLAFHAPVMASGTVLPYEVAAQVARTGEALQTTLDANNEDLIQTIISVIGAQTTAIVAALRANPREGSAAGGLTAAQVIREINRRTQMFGASPLQGV